MIGLTFCETMSGGYHLASAPGADRPMYFTVKARIPSLRSLLPVRRWGSESPDGALRPKPLGALFDIEGSVFAEGFAEHRALHGTLRIDPLRGKVLVYTFDFEGDDGARYAFRGQKTLGDGDLLHAITVLPGAIEGSDGKEIGRALLRFDLRSDLLKLLRSVRLVRS